jgi:predicted ATPase/DNA-binding SARP family transcriptional activator/predicted negative regulator of RcsB-dependent stress response
MSLSLQVLGDVVFSCEGQAIACPSRRGLWLAAWVHFKREPQSRAALAALFWPQREIAKSLGSLRVALTKLPRELAESLDIGRDRIGVAVGVRVAVDAHTIHSATHDAASLERACAAYRGALFAEVDANDDPAFADALAPERAQHAALARAAHARLAASHQTSGAHGLARDVARAWLRHEPIDEAMQRLLIESLARHEGPAAAHAQFEHYRQALATRQGRRPSSAELEWFARLTGNESAMRALPARLVVSTPLIGRDAELADLAATLADPHCRLLTLHGPGGAGKTRLALALAAQTHDMFPDGAFAVALDDLQETALFGQTVARACGLEPSGAANPIDVLAAFFRGRAALLVLDNLEQLLEGSTNAVALSLAALLCHTQSRFKILVTSRKPVQLQEEWVFPVDGLSCTAAPEGPPSSAVQLFGQRARQAKPGFRMERHLEAVGRIATLLEGLPLGLELTASLAGSMSLDEIHAALERAALALESRDINRNPRHRSLSAAVSFSWVQLAPGLRQSMMALSILRGSFDADAAESVASTTRDALAALALRAMIIPTGDGRWHVHEVVRQFAWEQSADATVLRETLMSRRDTFYLRKLADIRSTLEGPGEVDALARIEQDAANVREAWRSAAVRRGERLDLLIDASRPWFDFLECRGFVAEGIAAANVWVDAAPTGSAIHAEGLWARGLFERAASRPNDALQTLDAGLGVAPESATTVRARLHAARAFTLYLLGRLPDAEQAIVPALALAEPLAEPSLLAAVCRIHGLILLQSGRREAGHTCQMRALALADTLGRPSLLAAANNNLAMAESHLGNYDEAEARYQAALAYWSQLGDTANTARVLHNLGVMSLRRGDFATALDRYRTALPVLKKSGDRNLISLNLMSTGDALIRLDRPSEARDPAQEALEMAERDGHMLPALDARIVLANAATRMGGYSEAAHHLALVLDQAARHNYTNVLANAVVSVVKWMPAVAPERCGEANRWAHAVALSTEVSANIRDDARVCCAAVDSDAANTANLPLMALAHEAGAVLLAYLEHV